jgi:hypothetical protein
MYILASFKQPTHHNSELFKGDLSIAILVNLVQDTQPDFFAYIRPDAQHFFDFIGTDGSSPVFVVQGKSLFEFLVLKQLISIDGCCYEFTEVNFSTVVNIDQFENLVHLFLGEVTVEFFVALEELVVLKLSVFVFVELMEDLLQTINLFFGDHVLHHHAHCRLLHLLNCVKRK